MSEEALGYYVYCVIRAGEGALLKGGAGVDAAYELNLIDHRELSAVVSRVRMDEFGAEALKRNLEDLAWLKRIALAHNAILARARAAEAVVPFRTCTIFDGRSRVVNMLERERTYFLEQLERVNRRDEWGVKLLADRDRLGATGQRHHTDPPRGSAREEEITPGRAFFARKKLDRDLRQAAWAAARDAARKTHADLRMHAEASVLLPPQDPRVSGRAGEMVLNGAYLVDRSAAAEFAAIASELRERESANGFELELSGPFAPYNFVAPRETP
jgi:Gas vesicle synthesis protein GvpL/GvpF